MVPGRGRRKFEFTIQGSSLFKLAASPPSQAGKELDVCFLPAVERTPEVATLPSLDQMLPPPLPASTVANDIANTPPDATALQSMARRDLPTLGFACHSLRC